MNEYWMNGISKVLASWMWSTYNTGTKMIKTKGLKLILGSAPNYLYSKSCQSILAIEAILLREGPGVLPSSKELSFNLSESYF